MNGPRLRFKEFSGEWEAISLGTVTNYTKGFAFKSDDYQENGTRIIRVSDLTATSIKQDNTAIFISEHKAAIYNSYKINQYDIIITTVGSKPELTDSAVGRGILVIRNDEGFLNQNMLKLNKTEGINNVFLFGQINTERYVTHIKNIQRGNANQSNITLKDLFNFEVFIAELQEQTKIANFLTAVDEKIAQLTQKADLLARYKKGVMQQIFSQQLRFKDDDGREFLEWEQKTLSDFLIPEFREVEKPKEPYLSIGIRSHCKGTFQKPESSPEKNAMDNLFQVKENDLIVNITFAWEGAIAIVKNEDHNGLVSYRFPTYVFKEEITNAKFFQYVFIRRLFREQLDLISPGGAGRNRVMSKKDFLKIKCLLPTLPEQTKIAKFLTAIDDKISHNQTQLNALKQYKQGLLQQLFV